MLLVEPAAVQHLEALLDGPEALAARFGWHVPADFDLDPAMLRFALAGLTVAGYPPRWWTHLFLLADERLLVGLGGYKGPPGREAAVEIGYLIAPSWQGRGLGTQAARLLAQRALAEPAVRLVFAHTLAAENASTRILRKIGMTYCAEIVDPDDGPLWRWELTRA